jgi:hypothetical protein
MRPPLLQNEVEETAMATSLLCTKLTLIQKEASKSDNEEDDEDSDNLS